MTDQIKPATCEQCGSVMKFNPCCGRSERLVAIINELKAQLAQKDNEIELLKALVSLATGRTV